MNPDAKEFLGVVLEDIAGAVVEKAADALGAGGAVRFVVVAYAVGPDADSETGHTLVVGLSGQPLTPGADRATQVREIAQVLEDALSKVNHDGK